MCGSVKLWSAAADITPEELAKDGFYFLKKDDHCACIFCRGILGAWEEGDTVRGEHQKHFSRCPFINGEPVGNIPMPLCEYLEPMWRETVVKRLKDRNESPSGVIYAAFSLPSNREASFTSSSWSMDMKNKLVTAGFYIFCGISDHVRCFRCGLGLRDWSDSMDPLEMHAKYSPDCMVVKLFIGHLAAKTHHDRKKNVDDTLVDLVVEQGDIERHVAAMGFPPDTIKAAVKKRLLDQGIKFYKVTECIAATMNTMEQRTRVEMAAAQTLAAIAKRDEDRRMGTMDMIGTRSLNSSIASPEYFEILSDEDRHEALTMLFPLHQQQQEQRQEPIGDDPSPEAAAATSTRVMDLHYPSISEGADFDMGVGEVFGEGADDTTTELSEEEEGSPTALGTEETKANVEEVKEEEDEKPSIKNDSKSAEIMLELACKVCLCKEAVVVLFPCKHLCMCPRCAVSIGKCPVCRANIVDALKITRC
nr:MAG: inhibitor of apoptosis protein [Hemigrapsus takanoi nimavirus]